MILNIKDSKGKQFQIEVDNTDTIAKWRQITSEKWNIPTWSILLLFIGKFLSDDLIIADLQVSIEATIYAISIFQIKSQITMKVNGKNLKLFNILYSDTIEKIKCYIQDRLGLDYDSFDLYHKERLLHEHESILDLNSSPYIELVIKVII